jgi:Ca2+-transporting ATPase
MTSAYPYTRAEECSWQAEELARHITSLATANRSADTSSTHLLSHGWSSRQVAALEQMYGANVMTGEKEEEKHLIFKLFPYLLPVLSALYGQLKEPLIIMLLFSAGISLILGNTADAVSIGIALLIVSLVAAIQEYRSEAAIEALSDLVPHTCTVLRDGQVFDSYPASKLVIGDLVLLATGDRVSADCRVVDSVELLLDESSLTGENHPVEKTGEGITVSNNPPLTEQANMVFAGTLVTSGRGRAVVVAVGEATEFGKVATELQTVTSRKSPLQNKIDELSQRLAFLSTAAISVIAVLGWIMGRPFLETLTVAVSLAVAAIPEGLPICVTVTLALGTLRMARRNAIVKKLPVVESLGCATSIASDKTGTLTQNEMTVRAVFTLAFPKTKFGFTGVGYSTTSGKLMYSPASHDTASSNNLRSVGVQSPERMALQALFNTGCLCNNATRVQDVAAVDQGHCGGALSGQPTELSLLVASEKAGFPDARPQYTRLQETPFTSERFVVIVVCFRQKILWMNLS